MKISCRKLNTLVLAFLVVGTGRVARGADIVATNLPSYLKTQEYTLTNFSFPRAYYDEVLTNVFRKFLAQCDVPTNCQIVTAKVADWTAERDKVAAGQLKYQGKWYADDYAAMYASDVRAEQLLAAQDNSEMADKETAALWKSGRFHEHSPLLQPPPGEPPTYCFAGKVLRNGKPSLYIAYICLDPNIEHLVLHDAAATPQLSRDDGIEVFLDPGHSRTNYYQIIVNARGDWWSGEIENHGQGKYEILAPWNPQPEIKTEINRAAGRWMCEISIPFNEFGGVPTNGAVWGVNFARNFRGQQSSDDGEMHLQTWFNVFDQKANLHVSERFGEFVW